MVTREYTYKKAFENKREALKKRQLKRQLLTATLYKENPRLTEIENEMRAVGAGLVTATLSGDKARVAQIKEKSQALSQEKAAILKAAKIPEDKPQCSKCKDSGYIGGKICSCIKTEANRIMAKELSKEMPLENNTFDNFDLKFYPDTVTEEGNPHRRMTAILKLCKDYVKSFGKGSPNLLFTGNAGLGKTHLTMAIVGELINKGFLPVYGSAENLFSIVEKEEFGKEGKGNYEAMLTCDLLVIDDLGTEMVTAFTKSVLYNLINTRLLSGKPTVINTNLSMKEIEVRYSARISSRLIGHYNANKFLGQDIRQQKLLG